MKKTSIPDNANVTLRDIAKQCGVSLATASRALQHSSAVTPQTTERILTVAAQLGYDPAAHHIARRMSLQKYGKDAINHLLALIFPERFYRTCYFSDIFQGLLNILTPNGYGLLTIDIADSSTPQSVFPCFNRGDVDGVIVCSKEEKFQPIYEGLRQSPAFGERPIIFLNELHRECSYVVADKEKGSYEAAKYLFTLGHRHILYLMGPDNFYHDIKPDLILFTGLQRACIDCGLDAQSCLHPSEIGDQQWQMALNPLYQHKLMSLNILKIPSSNPLLKTLHHHPEITAIITQSDNLALVVHHMLLQHHIRIPEAISLIGFDDTTPICDDQFRNILTTVRVPLQQLGQTAAQLMIDQLTNTTKKVVRKVLPTKLTIRKTTAPPGASRQ